MHHNNSNNSEAPFVKLSEKSNIFYTEFMMFDNNSLKVSVLSQWRSKERNNSFVINEI